MVSIAAGCFACDAKPAEDAKSKPAEASKPVAANDAEGEPASPTDGPSAGKATVAKMFEICKAKDGAALHAMMGDEMRKQVDDHAARMAGALSPRDIAEAYGYEGEVEKLDGPTYLTMALGAPGEHDNMCWRSSEWKLLLEMSEGDAYGAFYELPSGLGRSVMVEKGGAGWTITQVSKSLRPEQWPDEVKAKVGQAAGAAATHEPSK